MLVIMRWHERRPRERFDEPLSSARPTRCCGGFIVCARSVGEDAVLFLRNGRLLFARHASPLAQDPSGWPRLLVRMLFGVRPTASPWLDLAVGRLRLDRLSRNGGGATFFPWASPIPRAGQESLAAAILRCAAARVGAASIAFGFQIAIEAAVVARLENSKEK